MKNRKSNPKVSVIVAVYNQEHYIGRCLRSLLHQTLYHSDYEIIVVDDGSIDRTSYALSLFCDPFESIVKVLTNKANQGLPSSINKALKIARAPYIVRVDSDDFVNINFLNFLHYYLESNKHADAVACDYLLIDDKENELKRCNCDEEPIACGIMFRKKNLFDIGLYDESFHCHEDQELRVRFKKKYNIHRLNLPLYRYRRHGNNMTNDSKIMDYHYNRLIKKHNIDTFD
jgi:glycosyltransferase involved in cell wall biosynthesis